MSHRHTSRISHPIYSRRRCRLACPPIKTPLVSPKNVPHARALACTATVRRPCLDLCRIACPLPLMLRVLRTR